MSKRYYELDSLRGLAAMTVVIHHCLLINTAFDHTWLMWLLYATPLGVFRAGHEAVVLFFVLSGFVLSIPFLKGRVSYPQFITKRILRIYLPYYAALAFALVGCFSLWHDPINGLGIWFNQTWSHPIQIGAVLRHILLIVPFPSAQYNTAFWSLGYEMRVSLLFPFVAWLVTRRNWRMSAIFCVIMSFAGWYVGFERKSGSVLHISGCYFTTFHYAAFFVVGGLLARYREYLVENAANATHMCKWSILLIALLLYTSNIWFLGHIRRLVPTAPFGFIADWMTCLGASIMIIIALSFGHASRVLLSKPVHFLGKISYSIYLTHATILFGLVHMLHDRLPIWSIWCLTLPATVLVSAAFYFVFEIPSVTWGQKLARRLPVRKCE